MKATAAMLQAGDNAAAGVRMQACSSGVFVHARMHGSRAGQQPILVPLLSAPS
jgi:hypothetical protein